MTMYSVALALTYAVCISHGRRIHSSNELSQAPEKGLAKLLMASNPSASFNPSGGLAGSRPVPMDRQNRIGHRAPLMGSVENNQETTPTEDSLTEPTGMHMPEMDFTSAEALMENINPATVALGFAALAALQPEEALAKGGEFGIFEGRIVSLAHPTVMALTYAMSAFAGFTGWQWRRLRELGTEVNDLKKERKPLQAKLDAASEDEPPETHAKVREEVAALTTKIDEITATRKEMANANLKDKHWLAGSVILGLGTSFAIEGPVNTFLRAQKLFPGPHLYAGAGIVVAWALAASLVPQMQKGKDFARNAHIACNALAIALFTWQIPTGWEITQKVIKFTKFP